jgi:hypothetical protein
MAPSTLTLHQGGGIADLARAVIKRESNRHA